MRKLRKIRENFGSLLFLAGLAFVLAYVLNNWAVFSNTFSNTNLYLFSLSVLVLLSYNFLMSLLFWRVLTRLGFPVKSGHVARTLLVSQVAKYVPGKVWMIFFQQASFGNTIPITFLTLANMYFILLAFVLTLCIGVTALILTIDWLLAFPAIIFGSSVFLLIQKNTFFWRIFGRLAKIQPNWNLERYFVQSQTLFYPLIVATYILAHYWLIQSLYCLNTNTTLLIVSTLALSWTLSSLAIFIPSGIILRELIFFAVTSYSVPDLDYALIASIAVASRFWLFTADMLGAIAILPFFAFTKEAVHE